MTLEAASLILGRARSMMGQFVAKGALMGVTDSVLLPAGTNVGCSALDELKSVGSDLKQVCTADRFWSLRTRVYVLWEKGKPVKWARHAFHMTDDDFLRWVEQCATKGEVVPLTTHKTRLVTLKEAVQRGKTLGA